MKNLFKIQMLLIIVVFVMSCKKEETENPFICGTSTVTDIDGNVYHTVSIGNQCWLQENLKTTKYNNGDLIGTTSSPVLDISATSDSTYKYQWAYNGVESNVATYGRLYTWAVINDSRGICPEGWHVPTKEEYTQLSDTLGGIAVAGGALKAITKWNLPNTGATDSFGFTAYAGGWRPLDGAFEDLNNFGHWWTSSIQNTNAPYFRVLYYDSKYFIEGNYFNKNAGLSIRCLKDE